MARGDAEADGRRHEIEASSHHVFIAIGAEDAGGSARGEITAAGRVNPPDPLARMLAGLTINSNHRGDGGVCARPLFPPGRKRNSERSRRKRSRVEEAAPHEGWGDASRRRRWINRRHTSPADTDVTHAAASCQLELASVIVIDCLETGPCEQYVNK